MSKLQERMTIAMKYDFNKWRKKDLINYISEKSDELDNLWVESKFCAFDIYTEFNYLYSTANCYITSTSNSIKNAIIYFKENNIDYKNLRWFDDYNGLGFTTLDIIEAGVKDVSFFNDCEEQYTCFSRLLDNFKYNYPIKDNYREGKYDVVCSFEIIEHNMEPLKYLDNIMNMVNDGGYLLFSHTFVGNKIYMGHFPYYNINDEIVTNKAAVRRVMKYLRNNGFVQLKRCFNQKPYIFKKVGIENDN